MKKQTVDGGGEGQDVGRSPGVWCGSLARRLYRVATLGLPLTLVAIFGGAALAEFGGASGRGSAGVVVLISLGGFLTTFVASLGSLLLDVFGLAAAAHAGSEELQAYLLLTGSRPGLRAGIRPFTSLVLALSSVLALLFFLGTCCAC